MSQDISPIALSSRTVKKPVYRRPPRENWGFHAKTYGGIGFLVFDSKFKVGRKGLLVSRGHDHVGDGIHKYHAVKQPYQVTSLSKSACRPNDELVPCVNKVDIVSITRDAKLLTKRPSDHDCFQPIFEVFPNFDVNHHKQNMEVLTSKQRILGAKNIAALENLNKNIYSTTSHRLDYNSERVESKPKTSNEAGANKEKPKKTVRIKTPHPMPGRELMFNDVLTHPNENNPKCVLCNCQISVADFLDGTTDYPICNYCKSTGIFRLDFYENPYEQRERTSRQKEEQKNTLTNLSLSELRRLTGSKVASQGAKAVTPGFTNEPNLMKLIKAPRERTDSYTSPLNYLGYYCGRRRNRLPSLIRKLPNGASIYPDIDDVAVPHEAQTPKRISFKRVAIPVSLKDKDYLKQKGLCCSEHFLSKDANNKKEIKVSDVLPDVHFPSCEEARTCAEDHQVLETLANKISAPQKVKTFKTEAHKRYHEHYPELIPDLRESKKTPKKYFFHGYHTSVFRG